MHQLQRILVCIDDPDRDCRMLDYVSKVCVEAETRQIHLLHAQPAEFAPLDDMIPIPPERPAVTPDQLRAAAAEHLKGYNQVEIVGHVVTASPLMGILRYGLDQNIDLIVIGRGSAGGLDTEDEATLARRVTQKATCSVLVLPEKANPDVRRILVPARDSECSANALEMAAHLAAARGSSVCCLNVFCVTAGYERVGTTLEEHTALLHKAAERECNRLLQRADLGGGIVQTKCVSDPAGRPVPIILKETLDQAADLVVIGARGRSGAAGVLLGTVTEQLICQSTVPLLAVKKKGECLGVLRALLTIVE